MKIAYLIDRNSVGGGMEYVRRQMAAHPNDETRVFFSDRGDCTAAKMNAWGAEVIHVNHLRALLQLFRNPFVRPHGRVIFTVHGIHLRKYDFLPKSFINRTKRLVRLSLERWLYRKCDQLIALTETDAKDIKRLYGENLPVAVEANSIDVSSLKNPVGLKYCENEFAFVCIARFDFQKGQDILVKAMVNIMLINVFKTKASRKNGDFIIHCMMDEIGKLHPSNVSGILQFANVRNIYLINSSPIGYNADIYKYNYLLTKDGKSQTHVT